MANAVTSRTLVSGNRKYVLQRTVVSDGTNESAATAVDKSSLGFSGDPVVQQVWYSATGVAAAHLEFVSGGTNPDVLALPDEGMHHLDFRQFGGLSTDDTSATGDIAITSTLEANDAYTLILEITAG